MVFRKPHLPHEAQLKLLADRGLDVPDETEALRLLKFVGYYRLGAYIYPFRVPLPLSEQRLKSRVQMRSDAIAAGTSLEDVDALRLFDADLRLMVLEALEDIEIAIGALIVDVIAREDIYGHTRREFLDPRATSRIRQSEQTDEFDLWMKRYTQLQWSARHEQFAIHHLQAYGEPFPVWIAMQFLDFGALTKLYGLLRPRHQNSVAATLGIKGGSLLESWGRQLNYVRNVAAHNNRLWNRVLTYKVAKFNPVQVGPELQHTSDLQPRDKIYVPLSVIAYLIKSIDPNTTWPSRMRELILAFPISGALSPQANMGFPADWADQRLWMPSPDSTTR